jgi:tetratricopeptide (TPR) repeat protein
MRLILALLATALLALAALSAKGAPAGEANLDLRRSMGNLRPDHANDEANLDLRRSMGNLRPDRPHDGYAVQAPQFPRCGVDCARIEHDTFEPDYAGKYPYHGDAYWPPYYPPPYDYPYYVYPPRYRWRYPYFAPLYIPAEAMYGPQALRRFLGVRQVNQVGPLAANPPISVVPGQGQRAGEAEEPLRRASNERAFGLGWRFIGFGDAHFGNQKYRDAYSRYKKAAEAAPALADAYLRQAFALVALGNYSQAVKVLKRGIELDPAWPRSQFQVDELYGNNQLDKTAHLGDLAQAAAAEPNDADLLFLLGVLFHFDGEPGRAAPLLERAARSSGGNPAHLRGFLELAGQPQP